MEHADTIAETVQLSVVLPVYNAEQFIAASVRELVDYLAGLGAAVELIVVDDGSSDGTPALLEDALAAAPVSVKLIRNPKNLGKGAAIRLGMGLARGAQRVFLDADLAYPPAEIAAVRAALAAGAEVAIASRVHRESRYLIKPSFFRYLYTRHAASRAFNWLVRLLLLPGIRDSQAGLKGFTAAAAERLFSGWLPRGFGFDLAVLFRARRLGLAIAQVPVFYRYDSEPTTVRFLLDSVAALRDVLAVRVRIGREPAASAAPAGLATRALAAARSPANGPLLAAALALALGAVAIFRLVLPHGGAALVAWLVALTAGALLALRADLGRAPVWPRLFRHRWEAPLLLLILAVAAFLRFYRLAEAPPMIHVDSAECGLLGLDILKGRVADLFEFSRWYRTPYLSYLPYAGSFALAGETILGHRLPSAVFGTALLVPLYALVRGWYGARVALTATAMLAVSHGAIHFSRIGLWNIQTLFLAVTAFAFLFAGLRRRSAFWLGGAGAVAGLALYSYTAGRLILVVCAAYLLLRVALRRSGWALRAGAIFIGGALVAASPLFLNYIRHPEALALDRTGTVFVFAPVNRNHVAATLRTTSTAGVLQEQARLTLAGFYARGDTSTQYGTGQPLLSRTTAALAALGVLLALWRLREARSQFLLLWTVLGLVLGSVLVLDPPSYTRLIVLFPVPYILAATALEAVLRLAARPIGQAPIVATVGCLLLVGHSAAFNLSGYLRFIGRMDVMPREWDVTQALQTIPDISDCYLFTGYFLIGDSPVLRLFAGAQRTITGVSATDVPEALSADTVFVLTPEFRRLGPLLSERFPGIERRVIEKKGERQLSLYLCTTENACRRSGP